MTPGNRLVVVDQERILDTEAESMNGASAETPDEDCGGEKAKLAE
jgi:hypothetical protein